MKIGEAKRIIGSLGRTLKLPGSSYGLPASACITGQRLAKIPGSVCSVCYALRGQYPTSNVVKAQHRRLGAIRHPLWVEAMVVTLLHAHRNPLMRIDLGVRDAKSRNIERFGYTQSGWHRWFDAGDLQSVEHLAKITQVCDLTPQIKHWLPTQELTMVRQFLTAGGVLPANLVIRVSSVMIDDISRRAWPTTSSVSQFVTPEGAHVCPAPRQDHKCGPCRACWNPKVEHVAYEQH